MHTYINSKTSNKIPSFGRRPTGIVPVHNHQEKRPIAKSPVEFRDNIVPIPQDTRKLIFEGSPMNRKEPTTPQHDDNIRFAKEEWDRVRADLNRSDPQQRKGCVQYVEKIEYKNHDFKPFDLEEYWGQRLLKGVLEQDKQ